MNPCAASTLYATARPENSSPPAPGSMTDLLTDVLHVDVVGDPASGRSVGFDFVHAERGPTSFAARARCGIITESMPSRATPRRMNGITVVFSAGPPVSPLAATAPP